MQDPTEKHFGDVGILDKYEVNNNNNNNNNNSICLISFSLSSAEHAPMTLSWALIVYLLTLWNDW